MSRPIYRGRIESKEEGEKARYVLITNITLCSLWETAYPLDPSTNTPSLVKNKIVTPFGVSFRGTREGRREGRLRESQLRRTIPPGSQVPEKMLWRNPAHVRRLFEVISWRRAVPLLPSPPALDVEPGDDKEEHAKEGARQRDQHDETKGQVASCCHVRTEC